MSRLLVVIGSIFISGCAIFKGYDIPDNVRGEMVNFVSEISSYSRSYNPDFIVIPQNGHELLSDSNYLSVINGVGREDLFFGYKDDNISTDPNVIKEISQYLDIAKEGNIKILVTDYCSSTVNIENSYSNNFNNGYISFAADRRELDNIPLEPSEPYNVNSSNIETLSQAKNFLYLINPSNNSEFPTKESFLNSVKASDYDVIIMDLFFDGSGNTKFTKSEIDSLKVKSNGGSRLVICYMSIGEAEDYRYYWNSEWDKKSPEWLAEENPFWPGNYKVLYWLDSWKSIILGNQESYLKQIVDVGFNGVYLDIIDAYEYYE